MIKLELFCPKCEYHYWLELMVVYPVEVCPICGCQRELPMEQACAGGNDG